MSWPLQPPEPLLSGLGVCPVLEALILANRGDRDRIRSDKPLRVGPLWRRRLTCFPGPVSPSHF